MSSPSCLAHALTARLQNSSLWGSRRSSLPGAQSECASVNTLRFIYPFQSGRFPRRPPPRTLTDAVTVSVVPRHRVGLRAVSCAHTVSFQEGSRRPLPQRLVRVQVAPHPCRRGVEEGRGRTESPTPLGTDSRPQTFSPFSAPEGKTVGKNQWVRPTWGMGEGHGGTFLPSD